MRTLVFLLEEESMAKTLDTLLPRVLPEGVAHRCLFHEGKQDLERSIPRKLRGWRTPDTRFVVVRDQDRADCHQVKASLAALSKDAGRPDTLVRIVCRELEAWFLGDLPAVAAGLGKPAIARFQAQGRYRQPDAIDYPSRELRRLVPGYQKVGGAKAVAPHLDLERNTSHSFHVFIAGVRRIALEP